ncbi:alpha/beta hydrolase family esterase [Acinetobacter soli]|uniref:alpha/beta hydrolase family esterase n=1 Tax=Acinetobacter soli TaxID=487316 RepID=UPI00124FA2BB|nr:dienelactone hydrolase family protein [Acinetobacter soli]
MFENKVKTPSSQCRILLAILATLGLSTATQAGWVTDKIVTHIQQSIRYHQLPIVHKRLNVDQRVRSFELFNPNPNAQSQPLVIALHGGGGNSSQMIKRFQAQAKAHGFLLVAPQGIGPSEKKGVWNSGGCCGDAVQQQVDDVRFIQQLIAYLKQHYAIDSTRIYIAGFSNGGMLTYQLAEQMGTQLAAVAVVSGAMFEQPPVAKAPVPILMIHGTRDHVVPVAGGVSSIGFVAKAQTKAFEPIQFPLQYWKAANQCQTLSEEVMSKQVTRLKGEGCAADLMFYQLAKGHHVWPASTNPHDRVDASTLIWSFFERHHR